MQTNTQQIFTLTNAMGTTVELDLIGATQLAQFIGFMRAKGGHGICYRYYAYSLRPYKPTYPNDSGLYGTYTNFVIDWFKNRWGHDHKILFRFGHEENKLTTSEVNRVYTALTRFIAVNVKGLKFPSWRNLPFHQYESTRFTGYGFSENHPGQLVEYKDGEVIKEELISHYCYTKNKSMSRPDFVNALCFGNDIYDYKRGTFVLSSKPSMKLEKR